MVNKRTIYLVECSQLRALIVFRSRVKLCAQRNETKQFQNSFKTVLFQFHFVVRTVLRLGLGLGLGLDLGLG